MQSAQACIETYIRAKDENRPFLMERVFAENATLQMVVKTEAISFPPISKGLESITDTLVRRFAQTYENVHTLCLAQPPRNSEMRFSCSWLVAMSEKDARSVRVGCGRYDWLFTSTVPRLVEQLTITVEAMQSLDPTHLGSVMNWLSGLPHPWCEPQRALRSAPALDALRSLQQYIDRVISTAPESVSTAAERQR